MFPDSLVHFQADHFQVGHFEGGHFQAVHFQGVNFSKQSLGGLFFKDTIFPGGYFFQSITSRVYGEGRQPRAWERLMHVSQR